MVEVRRPEARALALLAVDEIAANVVEHGYRGEAGRPLGVTFRPLDGERFEITVRDRAPVIDVTARPVVSLRTLARKRAPRGRGLAMVRRLAESLRHRSRPGGGNELTLIFDAVALSRLGEEPFRDAA